MSDIVDRLRWSGQDAMTKLYSLGMAKLHAEAADEIERLRAEVAQQRQQWEDVWRRNVDLLAEIERLGEIVRQRTFLLDQQMGTPCEQIRHEQEVERLKVALVQQAGIMHRFGGRDGEGEGDH